ncbi:MAG: DUF2007 domain-containing protein [Armatimonadota bacterium]
MPYCPDCKYEYNDGIKNCPVCGAELVSELPPEEIEDMVPIYVAEDTTEAAILRSILEEAGIPVRERADVDTDLDAFGGPIAEEAITVPKARAEEAKKILKKALERGKRLPAGEE